MRIGLFAMTLNEDNVDAMLAEISRAEANGFASFWFPTVQHNLLITSALASRVTHRIELGTAVVPIHYYHPAMLANMALALQAATQNRFSLGISSGHRTKLEYRYGFDGSKPNKRMREYLKILNGLVRGHWVDFCGEFYKVDDQYSYPRVRPPQILVAALGPQMLQLAGEMADGTITWLGGLHYLETQAIPIITRAATAAGRPAPRIIAGFPMAITNHADAARAEITKRYAIHASLPAYRRILDVEGASDASGASIVGSEHQVERAVKCLASIGVNDLMAVPIPFAADPDAERRTYDWLAALARAGGI